MAERPFVHLHCHTDYSLLDGACDIKKLMALVERMRMPAIAMTDHGNLFGAVEFYNEATNRGIHPVIGCEVYVSQLGYKTRSESDRYNHLVSFVKTRKGIRISLNWSPPVISKVSITSRGSIKISWRSMQRD